MGPLRLLTFAVLGAAALACAGAPAAAGSWRPRLGIEGGVGLGHLNSSWAIGPKMDSKFGGSAGLVVRWDLAPGWRFEFAPAWQQVSAQGTSLSTLVVDDGGGTFSFSQSETKRIYRFHRMTLPLRAARRLGGSGGYLEAGLAPSWLARAQRREEFEFDDFVTVSFGQQVRPRVETTASIFEDLGGWDDVIAGFHRWDLSVLGGVGWEFPIGARSLHVRGFWQQGVTDAGKSSDPIRVSALALTLGLLW